MFMASCPAVSPFNYVSQNSVVVSYQENMAEPCQPTVEIASTLPVIEVIEPPSERNKLILL